MDAAIVPVSILTPGPQAPSGADRERIAKTAKDFEASFLSIMLGQMYQGVGEGEFSGGPGEAMFKSFLMDAFSNQMSRAGGVGIAESVQREMLKMQGLE